MSDIEEEKKITPYILCFDEAHKLCPLSWQLLTDIARECEGKIVILLIIQSDDRDRKIITPNSVESFEEFWFEAMEEVKVKVFDLPILKPEQIGEIILDSASKYRQTYIEEVEDMCKIVDPNNTIKSVE